MELTFKYYTDKAERLYAEWVELREAFEAKDKEFSTFFRKTLPAVMKENGLESWTMTGGASVSLKDKSSLSLTGKNREAALKWIAENGGASLISETCVVSAGDKARLDEIGVPYAAKRDCNTNSAKAFLLKMIEDGGYVPRDIVPLYTWQECEVR